MKRAVFKLVVFLVLGAAVNVAVAWKCVWAVRVPIDDVPYDDIAHEEADWWHSRAPEYFMFKVRNGGTIMRPGIVCKTMCNLPNEEPRDLAYVAAEDVRCGWPWLALHGTLWRRWYLNGAAEPVFQQVLPALLHRNDSQPFDPATFQLRLEAFPYGLLPVGFALNTLFYAVPLWVLVAGPLALRRQRRVRRGLCPHCQYPVGASPVCTECGKAVKPKQAEAAA